jgi:hypothetical protein
MKMPRPKTLIFIVCNTTGRAAYRLLLHFVGKNRAELPALGNAGEGRMIIVGLRGPSNSHGVILELSIASACYAALVRMVTNSSAAVGWMPIVASNCALVAPQLSATASPWMISPASGPTI